MVNFVVFTIIVALLFCITSIFLERIIPLEKSEILIITIISLSMLGLFPYLASIFSVYTIFLIYLFFIILCAVAFYFFYRYKHSENVETSNEVYPLTAEGERSVSTGAGTEEQSFTLIELQTCTPETNTNNFLHTIIEENKPRHKSDVDTKIPELPGPKEMRLLKGTVEENHKIMFNNVYDYISHGFKRRKAGELSFAVDCFIKAMQYTKSPELNVKLGLEVSAIYRQMGQNWEALELLKAIAHTCENFLEPGMARELKQNIENLEKEINNRRA